MLYATDTFTVTGGVDIFPLTFSGVAPGYIDEAHVKYYLGGELQDPASITFLTPTSVQISPLPIDGSIITLRRETSIETALVDWESRQAVTEINLDLNTTQMLYLAQEVSDLVGNSASDSAASALAAFISATEASVSAGEALSSQTAAAASALAAELAASSLSGASYRVTIPAGGLEVLNTGLHLSADVPNLQLLADGVVQYDAFPCDVSGAATTGITPYVNAGSVLPEGVDVLVLSLVPDALPDITQGLADLANGITYLESVEPFGTLADMRDSTGINGLLYTVKGHTTVGDGGAGDFLYVTEAAPGTYVDNGGVIIVPTGGDGSEAWIRSGWAGEAEAFGPVTTTNLQAALDYAEISAIPRVIVKPGTYVMDGQVTIPKLVSLSGFGSGNTIFTAEGNTTGSFPDNSVFYKTGGVPTALPALGVDVSKGAIALTFSSAHGLVPGDVVLLFDPAESSYSTWRTYYFAGEYVKVVSVLSTVAVNLEAPLYASYSKTAVDMYLCRDYGTGTLEGFTCIAPGVGAKGIVRGLTVEYCKDMLLTDVDAQGSNNASMSISKSYRITGSNIKALQTSEDTGFGTQYGLIIGNSQEIDVSGRFVGYRHAVAQGGGLDFGIPCRANRVHDFYARNMSGALASIDWHGNCADCVYEDGHIYTGGFNITGQNNRVSRIKAHGNDMLLGLSREIVGCDFIAEDIECFTLRNDVTRGIIDIGGNTTVLDANTEFGGQFIFRNITIDAPANTRHGILVRNRGFVGDYDVIAEGITYKAPLSNNASYGVVAISTVTGSEPKRVAATGIVAIDGKITPYLTGVVAATKVRQDPISGVEAFTTSTSVAVLDASVTWERTFAKVPHVAVNQDRFSTGSDRVGCLMYNVTTSGGIIRVLRIDAPGSNFTGAQTSNASYVASLMEW